MKVIVEAAVGVVTGAVKVTVAEAACVAVGESVSVDGLAVTPEGRPEMEMLTEPLKELSDEAVMVTAVLVAPAVKDSEPGAAVREKSGVGFGVELPPHESNREMTVRAGRRRSTLAKECMGTGASKTNSTVSRRKSARVTELSFGCGRRRNYVVRESVILSCYVWISGWLDKIR